MGIFGKIFGVEDPIKAVRGTISKINELETEFEKLTQDELTAKTNKWKEDLGGISDSRAQADYLDRILPEAFAAVRESSKRTLGQRHYDAQLIGGIVLHQGKIAEMKTGEGKTLAATLAVYLNALTGRGVHVVTVNDYLARRDASWMGQVYHYLGLSVGAIQHQQSFRYSETDEPGQIITEEESSGVQIDVKNLVPCSRKEAYDSDILYGTNNEFGFDFLRDNMARAMEQLTQRELNYAIVDEIDSILIDEARTPLIISAPDEESTDMYREFAKFAKTLTPEDYILEEKHRQSTYSEQGYEKLEQKYGQQIYAEVKLRHQAEIALRANALYRKDRDYVVSDNEVIIVDEFTGRLMHGRRFSEGLHQAIEAKEGVEVRQESRTLATITFQNYFRLYSKLSGMTGTAATEAEEFHKIYKLEVAEIPTNKPLVRDDLQDSVYKNEQGKYQAIIREIKHRHELGQPMLIGTISIEQNEHLSNLLKKAGVKHEILNAKNHEREASIIAQAGRWGAVTLATNIAGRGVDIILGGNPYEPEQAQKVKDLGGLHVLGTGRHESRRIDNQLRGRSGRQGDPGSTQFFLSLEDDLMRLFGGDRLKNLMETLNVPDDQPIENRMVSRSIESAQGKIEGMNFDMRKHVLEFDDVLNKQREVIYGKRRKILEDKLNLKEDILSIVDAEMENIVSQATFQKTPKEWDRDGVLKSVSTIFPIDGPVLEETSEPEVWIKRLTEHAETIYQSREEKLGSELTRKIEKAIVLQTIDNFWMDHLDTMDHLRQSVRLRGYAQKDPLVEYRRDGRNYFDQMMSAIDQHIIHTIYKVEVRPEGKQYSNVSTSAPKPKAMSPEGKKVGRNDPCPCGAKKADGSPVKYKHCHGK